MTTNIISLIIVLGVLVFFHEFGHFLIARLFGVGVEKFSLGFGPRIIGKKIGMTDYRISAIPLGGYVKMVGEEPDAEIEPEMIPYSFTHKSVYKRMLIVAAGPVFNVVLAIMVFWGLYAIYGSYDRASIIGGVQENSPAFHAGLQVQDKIMAIDGQAIETWDDMAALIKEGHGKETELRIKRGDDILDFKLKPELSPSKNIFGEDIERYLIGVEASNDVISRDMSVFEAFGESLNQTWAISEITVLSVVKMIQGHISKKELGGPIMIAKMAGDQARAGVINLISFIAIISINLAILNILPIPVLDGGHLVFFAIEAVKGSPVSDSTRETAQQVGMLILLLLMIFVFYNDLTRTIPT
ncbi:MAG: RIP metalloprotease RseP [Proteobacteria bacterium]|nr:RIP metalloprotease RseP [Pseudomonadota bacterium]